MFTKSCPEVCVSIIFLILLVFKHIRWVSDLRFWLGKTHSRIQCYYSRVGLGLTLLELLIFHWFYKHLEVYFRSCYSRVRPYYSRVGFLVSCLLKRRRPYLLEAKQKKNLRLVFCFMISTVWCDDSCLFQVRRRYFGVLLCSTHDHNENPYRKHHLTSYTHFLLGKCSV